jgi:hypothetical protein
MTVSVADSFFDDLGEAWGDWADGEGWSNSPAFLVVSDETDAATAALIEAGERLMRVDGYGNEVEPWQLTAGAWETPSFVSDIILTDRGPAVCVDTSGELPRPQGERMLRIIVEELEQRGVSGLIVYPGEEVYLGDFPKVKRPDVRYEPVPSTAARTWFVARSVSCTTTTGWDYHDFEYRARDGGWVWQRTSAERFADAPLDLIEELRREPQPKGRGQVTCILLPDDDSDWWLLPPIEIRQHR